MKRLRLFLFLIIAVAAVSGTAYAQGEPVRGDDREDRSQGRRPNLFAELGLSPDQVQQIQRINQARKPLMADAQRRMREANRNLDFAIYGDGVSETEFQDRLKDFQSAQAEVVRLRFESELAIRKVLSAEQLVRFRELRRRFAETRGRGQERRMQRRGLRPRPGDGTPPQRPGYE